MLVRCFRAGISSSPRTACARSLCGGTTEPSHCTVDEASKGWLLAYALDGKGGATQLEPWDEDAMRRALARVRGSAYASNRAQSEAPAGIWIHSDFKGTDTHGWLQRVVGRRIAAQTSSWFTEDLADTQPCCVPSPSSDALLVTLRAAQGLPTGLAKQGPKLVAYRIWLMRHLLITSRESMAGEGIILVPELEQQLLEGSGALTCGGLAAAIMERTMLLSLGGAQEATNHVFELKERLQLLGMGSLPQGQLELLRRDLAQVRYNVIMLRRYLAAQHEPLEALMQFCQLPEQSIFNEKAVAKCKRAQERHQTVIESLDATRNGGEVMQGEILALIGWGTAVATYRLTVLASLLGVLGFFSVSFDLLNFLDKYKRRHQQWDEMDSCRP